MKIKLYLCLVVYLSIFFGTVNAQPVLQVQAGQNTILDAVANAQAGDIIELTSDGGEYWNDDEIRFNFPMTIRAAEGLQNRPILMNNSNETTKDIIRLFDSATLIGLELDGNADVDSLKVKYAIRTSPNGAEVQPNYVLKVFDCYFHDIVFGSDGNAFRAYHNTFADTIFFEDCIFINTGKEAVRVRDEENERPGFGFFNVNYFEVTNSTFAETVHDAISVYGGDSEPQTPGPTVRINHVTLNRCGHYGINLKLVDDAKVKNSIITNNLDVVEESGQTLGGPWLVDSAFISHCDTVNIGGAWTGGNPTTNKILNADPLYADARNQDFTLALNSPVRGQADDGTDLGDLRWGANVTSVEDAESLIPPRELVLSRNYPNPFNAGTRLEYEIEEPGQYLIVIMNILGETVRVLNDGFQPKGIHSLRWQGIDDNDRPVSSGIYFVRVRHLESGTSRLSKMTLVR